MIKQTHGCGNMIKTTLGCIVKTIEKVTDCVCAECRVLLHGQSQSKVKINPLSISAVLRCFRFISQVQPVRILEDNGVSLFMEKTKLCNEMTFKIRKDCFGVISVLLIFIPPALDNGNVDIPSTFTNNTCQTKPAFGRNHGQLLHWEHYYWRIWGGGSRDAHPLLGSIFFIFMRFLDKFDRLIACLPIWGWAPVWEILDPPLTIIPRTKYLTRL